MNCEFRSGRSTAPELISVCTRVYDISCACISYAWNNFFVAEPILFRFASAPSFDTGILSDPDPTIGSTFFFVIDWSKQFYKKDLQSKNKEKSAPTPQHYLRWDTTVTIVSMFMLSPEFPMSRVRNLVVTSGGTFPFSLV